MNYNALLLFEKQHYNRKKYPNISNHNENHFYNQRNNHINIRIKDNTKYKKCYSVKPSIYMMPKDVIIKDIFHNEIITSNEYIKNCIIINNINNNSNIDRKYIIRKIKKFIIINGINYSIFGKAIYLYDLLFFLKDKIDNKRKNIYSYFNSLSNISIALIAFILVLKFNYQESKMISLKNVISFFEEEDEKMAVNEVLRMEIITLKLLDYNLTFQTPFSFMELFLINGILFNEDYINCDLSINIYELVNETLENIMECSNYYFKYNYFYLCCSIIMFIREKFKINKWPKALEITFGVKMEQFYETYNSLFEKRNRNIFRKEIKENKENTENKNNIKNILNFNLINISNLKNVSNIISVLKIMKSAEKYRKTNEKVNKKDSYNNISNKNDLEEDYKNNDKKEESPNKIKVGLKKNRNFSTFRTPGKFNLAKTTISNALIKLTEDNRNIFSAFYNKNNEESNNKECQNNKYRNNNDIYKERNHKDEEEKPLKNSYKNINIDKLLKKEEFNISEKNLISSCIRFKDNILIISKNSKERNNTNSNSNNINNNKNENNSKAEPNNIAALNLNKYKRRNYLNRKTINILNSYNEKNIELKNEFQKDTNINTYNVSSSKNLNGRMSNRLYSNYTEKKKNFDIKYDLKKKNENNINININQSSFNNFLFYKNKSKNSITYAQDPENYLDEFKLKNKEENSNAPTCESSKIRSSINDFSIRKSYKKRNTKNEGSTEEKLNLSQKQEKSRKVEKERRKGMEKNKSYNKITNSNNTTFSEHTYNRRTGVRKYYKQKNMENH